MTGFDAPKFRRRDAAAEYVREKWGIPCSRSWLAVYFQKVVRILR